MSIFAPTRSLAAVDPTAPINWNDPLNAGLRFWWLPLPGLGGGTNCTRDLVSREAISYTGTYLQSYWITTDRGYAWDYPGTYQGIEHTVPVIGSGAFSFAVWVRDAGGDLLGRWVGVGGQASMLLRRSSNNLQWYVQNATDTGNGNASIDISAGSTSTTDWWMVAGVADGSTLRLCQFYPNGELIGSPTSFSGPYLPSDVTTWSIGRAHNSYPLGDVAGVRYWNRALSLDELRLIHSDGRAGYPRTLSRLPRWQPEVIAPVTTPTKTGLIGGGIL